MKEGKRGIVSMYWVRPPLHVTSIEFSIGSPSALAASLQENTVLIPEIFAEVAVNGPTVCSKSLAIGCPTIRIAIDLPPILESNCVLPSKIHVNAPFEINLENLQDNLEYSQIVPSARSWQLQY